MKFNLQLLQKKKQKLVNQATALSTSYGFLLCTE